MAVSKKNMAAQIKLNGLPLKLVADGLLEEEAAINALEGARQEKISFTHYLVNHNMLSANTIAMEASKEFGLPVFDLDAIDPETIPRDIVDEKLIKKHRALPLYKRGNRLYIGFSDPTNLAAINDIKFQTGINTILRIGDLLRLTVKHVANPDYTIRKYIDIKEQKTSKYNRILITSTLAPKLKAYIKRYGLDYPDDYLFYKQRNKKDVNIPITRDWASKVLVKAATECGILNL